MMRLGMYTSAPHRRMGHFPRQMGRKRSFDAPTNRTRSVGRSCLTLPYVDREHTLRQPTTKRYLLAFHGMMINAAFPLPSPSHANPSFHSTLLPFSLRVIYASPSSVRPHISGWGKERKERVSGGYRVSKTTLGVIKKRLLCPLSHEAPRGYLANTASTMYDRSAVYYDLCTKALSSCLDRERERESVGGVAFREILGQNRNSPKKITVQFNYNYADHSTKALVVFI